MSNMRQIVIGSIAVLAICASGAAAATKAAKPAAKPAVASEPPPDPEAMAALTRMSEALSALQAFSIKADVTTEQVLNSGQKLQYAGKFELQAKQPDGFKISTSNDHQQREMYYDGKTLTVFGPRLKYYASVPAPPTIAAAVAKAKDDYDLEVPLADLFTWGRDPSLAARVRAGFDVGPETIDGAACEHYAFRQDKVDWQIWIRNEGAALPCKLVITSKDDAARPQYTAVMHWDVTTPSRTEVFTFTPPEGATRIPLVETVASK